MQLISRLNSQPPSVNHLNEAIFGRGGIYFYEFKPHLAPDGSTYTTEPHGSHPVALLDENAFDRLARKLDVRVVLFSKKSNYGKYGVPVIFQGKTTNAVISQATTVNSEKLENFRGTLSPSMMQKLFTALDDFFQMPETLQPGVRGTPGSIVNVPWNGAEMREFFIVGSAHLKSAVSPVFCVPVDAMQGKGKGILDGLKPRPISPARMALGKLRGHLTYTDTQMLQHAARTAYGL